VPFIQVDLAPEEEHLALAILDRITGMAEIDPAMLNMLLQDVNTGEAALQELLSAMADEAGIDDGKDDADGTGKDPAVCPQCGFVLA